MTARRAFVAFAVLALAPLARAADEASAIPAFSAEVELRAEGEVAQRWRLASSGERILVQPLANKDLETSVVDVAGKRVWMFPWDGKKCRVIPSKDPLAEVLGFPVRGSKEEPAGEEKISGLATRKSKVTTPEGETVFVWRAPELGGIPIRSFRPSDQIEVVYKKIDRAAPESKHFLVPPTCPK